MNLTKNLFFKIIALSIFMSLLLSLTSCRQVEVTEKKTEEEVTPEGTPTEEEKPIAFLPGITIEDDHPNGCIDCHLKVSDERDYRLNVTLAEIEEHPKIDQIVEKIPDDCMTCHKEGTDNAIEYIVHYEHYKDPEENHFISSYQGSCLNCHSMDIEEGEVKIKSGEKNW